MMLRYTFGLEASAAAIEAAVRKVLADGLATADIDRPGSQRVGTAAMGAAVVAALG
jgi:3-isopropylmalate dehydrogenase